MTARALPTSSAGLKLVHQPASRSPVVPAALPRPAVVRLLRRFAAWWRQAGDIDPAWQEQRRLRESWQFNESFRWITR